MLGDDRSQEPAEQLRLIAFGGQGTDSCEEVDGRSVATVLLRVDLRGDNSFVDRDGVERVGRFPSRAASSTCARHSRATWQPTTHRRRGLRRGGSRPEWSPVAVRGVGCVSSLRCRQRRGACEGDRRLVFGGPRRRRSRRGACGTRRGTGGVRMHPTTGPPRPRCRRRRGAGRRETRATEASARADRRTCPALAESIRELRLADRRRRDPVRFPGSRRACGDRRPGWRSGHPGRRRPARSRSSPPSQRRRRARKSPCSSWRRATSARRFVGRRRCHRVRAHRHRWLLLDKRCRARSSARAEQAAPPAPPDPGRASRHAARCSSPIRPEMSVSQPSLSSMYCTALSERRCACSASATTAAACPAFTRSSRAARTSKMSWAQPPASA